MSNKLKRRFAWTQVAFVIFLVGVPGFLQMCGIDTSESSQSTLRMVNGSVPGQEHPATWSAVALVDKASGDQFCSGTLIAPQLVVTAAHCVFDKRPEDMQILFGPSVKDPTAVKRDAIAKETFKKFQKFESNFDIAWVKFSGDVPAGFHPIEIWHSPEQLQPKTPLTIAGYGRTASNCAYDDASCQGGVRLFVDTDIREFVNHGRLFNLIVIGPRPLHGPCFGDSGGPAYLQVDGRWYVAGDFMGWDRLLVPEKMETICDSGEAIYNFVGDFVNWIEATSGVSLAYDSKLNPRHEPLKLVKLETIPTSFQGWCESNDHEDPAWFTVQRLLRAASDFRIKTDDPSKAREIFDNCETAEVWIRKMLNTQKSLQIPGFDPANFIDSARLEDLRPLLPFADTDVETVVLSDHSIPDLSPLAQFSKLKSLEIVDNTLPDGSLAADALPLDVGALRQLETLKIHNSSAPVSFAGLGQLTKLQTLELSYLHVPALPGLENLPLKGLRLDTIESQTPIELPGLSKLKTLFLSKIASGPLPEVMPVLEELELLETTHLDTLPKVAPQLRKLFLYATDVKGVMSFENLRALEEVSVSSNLELKGVSAIHDLPQLRSLEFVDNKLDSFEALSALPALKSVSLMRNGLKALPQLRGLPKLDKLDLDGNQLTAVPDLSQLAKLEYLNLSRNPLMSLRGIQNLKLLKRLAVQNQKGAGLASIEGLADLPLLEELNLAKNSIAQVDGLTKFSSLKVIVLTDNSVRDVSALKVLPKLEYLELVNNPLISKDCPISKAHACRFEWLTFTKPGS